MTRIGSLTRAVAVVIAAGALALGSALPAAAHGGEILLSVTSDGAGGVTVLPTYEGDGHPVQDVIDPVLTATSDSGKKIGPVSLISSSEGEGIWITEEPVLTDGHWKVTVTVTEPSDAKSTVEMDVAPLAEPIDNSAPVKDDATVSAAGATAGSVLPWAIPLGLLVIGAVVALLVVRSRRTSRAVIGR